METWRYRSAIFEELPSDAGRNVPWLIVRPNSGAGKPVKSTSFIRQVLEEIRRLNTKKKWWI